MPDLAPRYPCPVCLGVQMEKTAVGAAGDLVLDHCRRCGGIWFELGEVQQLKRWAPAELWERIPRREGGARMQCHDCHAPMDRGVEVCPACGWRNRLDCPVCQRPSETRTVGDLTLDACTGCKGVWFDHAELSAIWSVSLATALASRRYAADGVPFGDGADVVLHALAYSPDLVFLGARAAGYAVAASTELLASAPEAALGATEVLSEVAAGVFGAILEILGSIFDGL